MLQLLDAREANQHTGDAWLGERKPQRQFIDAVEVPLGGQLRQPGADVEKAPMRKVARVRERLIEQTAGPKVAEC